MSSEDQVQSCLAGINQFLNRVTGRCNRSEQTVTELRNLINSNRQMTRNVLTYVQRIRDLTDEVAQMTAGLDVLNLSNDSNAEMEAHIADAKVRNSLENLLQALDQISDTLEAAVQETKKFKGKTFYKVVVAQLKAFNQLLIALFSLTGREADCAKMLKIMFSALYPISNVALAEPAPPIAEATLDMKEDTDQDLPKKNS